MDSSFCFVLLFLVVEKIFIQFIQITALPPHWTMHFRTFALNRVSLLLSQERERGKEEGGKE